KMRAATMSVGESIGQRLRRLRLEKGLSQRELAGPGVSYAYVSRIEGGQRRPSLRAIRVLARKLGVSAQYLETGSMTTSEEVRERCLDELSAQDQDDTSARVRFGTHLSYALSNLGRFVEAREVLTDLTSRASAIVDPYARIRLYWSLARLAAMEGHGRAALR